MNNSIVKRVIWGDGTAHGYNFIVMWSDHTWDEFTIGLGFDGKTYIGTGEVHDIIDIKSMKKTKTKEECIQYINEKDKLLREMQS